MSDKSNLQILNSKLKSMTVAKKRRRKVATSRPAVRRRSRTTLSAPAPRRRRRLSAGGGGTKGIMGGLKTGFQGAAGGALYIAPQFAIKVPLIGKIGWGIVSAVGATMAGFPSVGAGSAGGMLVDVAKEKFATALKDAYDLEDEEWVDPNSLSDTGFCDEYGNAVVMDDDGIAYSLNDDGDYQAIGEASEIFALQDNMQSQSMIPLMDAYQY